MHGSNDLLTRLCPVCGRVAKALYDGVCEECFRASRKLLEVPETIEVSLCKVCGAYRLKGRWRRPTGANPLIEAAKAEVERSSKARREILSIDVHSVEGDRVRIRVIGIPERGMPPLEEEHEVALHVRWTHCSDCIMAKSRREAARIQVRARGRTLTASEIEAVKRIVREGLRTRWRGSLDLFEVEEKEGGIDFLFSSQSSARLAAEALKHELFATTLETHKAAGSASGRRVARITVRIQLPQFRPGDIIEFEGRAYYVLAAARTGVKVLCLQTYEERTLSNAKPLIERSRVLLKREELEPAIVASVTEGAVDAVLIRSRRAVSFHMGKRPDWLIEGGQVMLAFIDDRVYPVPCLHGTK